MTEELTIDTSRGPARAQLSLAPGCGHGALVLGHGAGGGIHAPDLQAARRAALGVGVAVALVEQPYRVAGRRSPAPAPALDEAWIDVVQALRSGAFAGRALITGGRSSGARVACRTAAATGAIGVLCLAFPLRPPARGGAARPAPSRLPELDAVSVPMLVVQGQRDRFGMPPARPARTVVAITGDHALKSDLAGVGDAVGKWLSDLVWRPD